MSWRDPQSGLITNKVIEASAKVVVKANPICCVKGNTKREKGSTLKNDLPIK